MKKMLPLILGVAVLVGAGAFYGGMKYAQAKAPARGGRYGMMNGQAGAAANGGGPYGQRGGFRGGPMNSGFVTGEILSDDGKTLTVKMRDGGSKIVFLSDTTEVSKFVSGTATDLEVGKSVTIVGKTNDDGSVTAQSVQLRPAPMMPPPNPSTR